MSVLSLVSAAQSAVEMSALAATAAEDAMAAAKLANVHAKAAREQDEDRGGSQDRVSRETIIW